ncbi:histidinol dehydrogenase [Candidatus Woesearchaeota archaeon]|nr:histidinol dehydrogenase [Candidatus Woesearchaeota archaeon]
MIRIYDLDELDEETSCRLIDRANTEIDDIKDKVHEMINLVRRGGDKALLELTEKFDGKKLGSVAPLDKKVIRSAYKKIDCLSEMQKQISLSKEFAEFQKKNQNLALTTQNGMLRGEMAVPLDSVGIYVPGGKNPFPTVVQTLAIPAKTAGVRRLVMCTPPRDNMDELLVAADLCGVDEIYTIGGAQAIAAMAYGTESIRPVDKIVGPGNPYVTAAKIAVFGKVDIDCPAGPSEVLIIADDTADPLECAYDILAKAEHGPDSAALMLTTSRNLAVRTQENIRLLLESEENYPRIAYIRQSLQKYCAIIITQSLEQCMDYSNGYAPEHLQIMTADPFSAISRIKNAGSVFLGRHNPVAVGDYASGVNHIIPTGRWARMFSPVGVDTFMKRIQISFMNQQSLRLLEPIVSKIADVEGLYSHKMSVQCRTILGTTKKYDRK